VAKLTTQLSLGPRISARRARELMLEQAQDLIYKAWETSSRKRRIALAEKALTISSDCADAYVLLAEDADASDTALELYQKAVEAGERALGKKVFVEEAGYFWGLLETRPYMRAREGLANCLWQKGQHDEAVAHYREMLRLNPNDNQGIRHVLAICLLELQYHDELDALLKRYEEDISAHISWTRPLLAFRIQGDTIESRAQLSAAREFNPHVPDYLLGRKKMPRWLPDVIGFGDEREAMCYAADSYAVWKQTEGALAWLAKRRDAEVG
jgi:tetratricopeptide (TPR) repeat protein